MGQGNFGKVYLVTHIIDNKQYALKILDKNEIFHKGEERHVMNERDILIENQKHPFVTSLYYSFQTKNELFLAMEYISGGEVIKYSSLNSFIFKLIFIKLKYLISHFFISVILLHSTSTK